MKLKRLVVSFELLQSLLKAGLHEVAWSVVSDPLPEDAELVNVRHAWPNQIEILVKSESFELVKDGDEIPSLVPAISGGFS